MKKKGLNKLFIVVAGTSVVATLLLFLILSYGANKVQFVAAYNEQEQLELDQPHSQEAYQGCVIYFNRKTSQLSKSHGCLLKKSRDSASLAKFIQIYNAANATRQELIEQRQILINSIGQVHQDSYISNPVPSEGHQFRLFRSKMLLLRSHYKEYILHDMHLSIPHNIQQDTIPQTQQKHTVDGWSIRITIVNGTLHAMTSVDGFAVPEKGFIPASNDGGCSSAKARISYVMLLFMDLLHAFPGQVPDVDLFVSLGDRPINPVDGPAESRVPVFSYDKSDKHADLIIPDFSYFGHEHVNLMDSSGQWIVGWDKQRRYITDQMEATPLKDRKNAVVFRGRSWDEVRDAVRREFISCPEQLRKSQGTDDLGVEFDLGDHDELLTKLQQCAYRYVAYLESESYSSSLKDKLSCGSLVLMHPPIYYEWWSRALVPNFHFASLDVNNLCSSTYETLTKLNASIDGDGVEWGVYSAQEIARNGAEFVEKHVTQQAMREYLLDSLVVYSSLQDFQPVAPVGSQCVTPKILLDAFDVPTVGEGRVVLDANEWLGGWDSGCASYGVPDSVGVKQEWYVHGDGQHRDFMGCK